MVHRALELQRFVKLHHLEGAVYFAGPCTHEQTQQHLAEADIFILPSFAEGLPVALMEAMAYPASLHQHLRWRNSGIDHQWGRQDC